MFYKAQWSAELGNSVVQCTLCPHYCILTEGKSGICKVRSNQDGTLVSKVYGYVSKISYEKSNTINLTDISRDSVFMFIGTYGCNFSCFFCRGCNDLLTKEQTHYVGSEYTANELVALALNHPNCAGIVFSYNEPTVWIEYLMEIAQLARQQGLKIILDTNGFINPEPLRKIIEVSDLFQVDVKAFSDEFYQKVNSSKLQPIMNSLKTIAHAGIQLQLYYNLIPELNDDTDTFKKMIVWVKNELSENTPLFLAVYEPGNQKKDSYDMKTILLKYQKLASAHLNYVHVIG